MWKIKSEIVCLRERERERERERLFLNGNEKAERKPSYTLTTHCR